MYFALFIYCLKTCIIQKNCITVLFIEKTFIKRFLNAVLTLTSFLEFLKG